MAGTYFVKNPPMIVELQIERFGKLIGIGFPQATMYRPNISSSLAISSDGMEILFCN